MQANSHETAHCNNCGQNTNCDLLHREDYLYQIELAPDVMGDGCNRYEMLRCRGCSAIVFLHKFWDDSYTRSDGKPIVHVSYYPPAISRKQPDWHFELATLDCHSFALLQEIYIAVHHDAKSLALMGVRALIEAIMLNAVGDKGSFKRNLAAFYEQGHVSKVQMELLEKTLEAGHAAIHRKYEPSDSELTACLDIAENLIEILIVLPQAGVRLSRSVPKRIR